MTGLWVLGFGAIGVGLRYAIDAWSSGRHLIFPGATLLINVAGCLLAGFIFNLNGAKDLTADPLRLGLIVGFCGGFTTFSGYGLQFFQLLEAGRPMMAVAYGVGSPVLCLLATGAGLLLSRLVS